MTDHSHRIQPFDCRGVAFPSDRITLGNIRMAFQNQFDGDGSKALIPPPFFCHLNKDQSVAERILARQLLASERILFVRVCSEILDLGKPHSSETTTEQLVADLCELYLNFGLATDKQGATQLIDEISNAARTRTKATTTHTEKHTDRNLRDRLYRDHDQDLRRR